MCPDIPEYIVTDQNRLRQVLINLIGNALKFTFTGGVMISASTDPNKEGYVNFKVADTGPGIKEEDKKKLFKMYGRLDQPDPKLNTQGVGFGLEISDQLARLLAVDYEAGGIKLESQEGKGTTFYFSIKDIDMNEDCPSPGVRGLNLFLVMPNLYEALQLKLLCFSIRLSDSVRITIFVMKKSEKNLSETESTVAKKFFVNFVRIKKKLN